MPFYPASLHILLAFFHWKLFWTLWRTKSYSHVTIAMNYKRNPHRGQVWLWHQGKAVQLEQCAVTMRTCVPGALPSAGPCAVTHPNVFSYNGLRGKHMRASYCFSWRNGGAPSGRTGQEKTWKQAVRLGRSLGSVLAHLLRWEHPEITWGHPSMYWL